MAHKFKQGYAYGLDPAMSESFAKDIEKELGYPVKVQIPYLIIHSFCWPRSNVCRFFPKNALYNLYNPINEIHCPIQSNLT